MRPRRIAALSSLFAGLALVAACGTDGNNGAPRADASFQPSDLDASRPDALVEASGPIVEPVVDFKITDVADTACSARGGTLKQLYPGAADAQPFDAIAAVGARRLARATLTNGYVLFDADGSNASAALLSPFADGSFIASTGSAVLAGGLDKGDLSYKRFDATGASLGAGGSFGYVAGDGLTLGGGGDQGLVVWGREGSVLARGMASDGSLAGDAFNLSGGAFTAGFRAAIRHDGKSSFAIAWTASEPFADSKHHRTTFVRTSTTSRVIRPRIVIDNDTRQRIVAITPTKTGFALLLEYETRQALLVLLDSDGRFLPPARRLVGTARAFGLASSGDEFAVVTRRAVSAEAGAGLVPDAVEFRPFDATGNPLGPWVCLDGPTTDGDVNAAILGEANGYSVLYRSPSFATNLVRFDRRGTGNLQ